MADIDTTKNVYLFTHGRQDLVEKSINALTEDGFSKDKIIMADPSKAGDVDDYMAMLWMPPNPDHIKIHVCKISICKISICKISIREICILKIGSFTQAIKKVLKLAIPIIN